MKKSILLFFCCCIIIGNCQAEKKTGKDIKLKVLQLNTWQETTMVEDGWTGIIDIINQIQPDIILLSEIRNYQNKDFIANLKQALYKKGISYEGKTDFSVDVGILSKYPIISQQTIPNTAGGALKALIQLNDKVITIYSVHLDYTHYACYLPRGYSGTTWKKINAPITDCREIEQANKASSRDEEIKHILADIQHDNKQFVIIGGDFNEPSHLDWNENTQNLWDHNGTIINWDCSTLLYKSGFKDAYRTMYPNPVTHPGFTYPANNPNAKLSQLDWVPEADGRDRIDFIYYRSTNNSYRLKEAKIVGPIGSIKYNKRTIEESEQDDILVPQGIWPSDHRGILVTFSIK